MNLRRCLVALVLALPLAGCGYLGIESPAQQGAKREAEGKAIGGACRHAGRALEDCYAYNPTAPKAAIFDGWKTMNDYMVENKIDVIRPLVEPKLPKPKGKARPPAEGGEQTAEGDGGKAAPAKGGHGAT